MRLRRFVLSGAPAACLLALAACSQGAYPGDIFPEMHHQASYRRLEPQRLAPADGAVPVTGGQPSYTFDQAASLSNPVQASAQTMATGQSLYAVNCAMCHGASGHGDGVIAAYFKAAGRVQPVDYNSPRVKARTDGQLFWLITNGIGGMPAFRELLTDQQRWTVIYFIHQAQSS